MRGNSYLWRCGISLLFVVSFITPGLAQAGDIRIRSLTFQEEGGDSSSSALDVLQDPDCDNVSSSIDPEPFGDSSAIITVSNTLSEDVVFRRLQFIINISGQRRRSKALPLMDIGRSPAASDSFDGTTELRGFLFETRDGKKYLAGTNTLLPSTLGARVLRVLLRGKTSRGRSVVLRARTAVAIGDYDRC